MALASRLRPEASVEAYDLPDANEALLPLKEDRLGAQAAVMRVS